MKNTTYQLIHRVTRKPIIVPVEFRTLSEAITYGLIHDLHVDVKITKGEQK